MRVPLFWAAMTMRLWPELERACEDERGQGLVEYALIIMLVSTVVIGALLALGVGIDGAFDPVLDVFS